MLMLGVLALFSDANILDALLMIAAACLAVLHGAVLPAAMFVFGLLTNAFVNQYSSAQLANYELEFDPLEYIEMGRLAAVDVRVILSGFINFTNITGGVVNCSDSYELLPFNQTFDDILQLGVTRLARCLDNPTFLALVNIYTVIFLGLGVASWLLGGAHVTLFRLSGVRQVRRLRYRLFSSLLRQEMGWFDATPPGEVVSRISEDVGKVEEGLGEKLGLLLQWMATLVAGVIVSVLTEWRLTLLMAFAGLLIAGSTAVLSVVTSVTTSRSLSLSAAASAIAEEALAAIATVKAFCAEDEETKRYSQALQGVRWYGSIVGVVRGGSLGVVQLLVFGCYASSFWLGAYLVQEELIQAGEFVTVFFAVLLVGVSVGQTLPHLQRLIAANTADRRLQDLATRVPLVAHYEEEVWLEGGLQPSIQFQNVTFSYPTRPQLPVLKDVNFSIAPGEIVAIVGATGSGKSTIGHLLTRLYDISKGEVTVGGVDVRQLPMERLREQVGVVSQDPALFQTSIAENIGLGSGGVASQEAIELAACQAYAHEFITQLPQGYSTVVGSRGSQLSGGQRQRLAIARALVRNPKILLLDEATSALDTESERMVQEALDKAREGRTTIIIAHRLSTVRHANTIIVMEKGGVAEMGSHEELLKKEGVYYNLVHTQLTDEVVEGESAPSQSPLTPLSPLLSPGFATELSQVTEEEKTSTSASWFSVLRLSMNEFPLLVVGVIAAGVQGAVFPSFSIFFGRALEAFTFPFNQVFGLIHQWAGLFLALGFVSAVSTVIKNVAFSLAGEELVYRLRCRGLSQALRHHLSWFDQPASTGVAGVLASSPPLVPGVMLALSSLTEVSVGLAAALIISFVSSWILALVIILFIPLLLVAGLVQVQLLRSGTRTETPSTQILQESVVNMKIVQLFGLQQTFLLQYTSSLAQSLWRRCIEAIGVGVVYGFTNFILLAAYAVTFRFAAYLLTLPVDHTLYANFDEVFTVFLAIILGSLTAGQASTALPLATQATAAASKLQTVMTTAEGEVWEGRQLEEVKGKVDVVNVSFSFPSRPAVQVLSRLSVSVAAGESLALVGPSGAGKSTVFSLLERLYSPGSGQLTVDDTDISSLGLRWWRRQLGWVPQDVVLFNRTISENISFGCEAGEEQIVAAATAANAHFFILSLPQGYSTVVGSRGSQLSGGQRQRLAIARALVRNPKILLLDEATSALDTESERMVQEALDKAREGRTTIIIAHRLSTVAKADQIAVLHAGRVVERGNHSQLLQHQGLYWRLLQTNQQPS